MTDSLVPPTWEPTEAEHDAFWDAYTSAEAFRLARASTSGSNDPLIRSTFGLRAAGRLIAARALREAADQIEKAWSPAHTYSSENADHYRGYDVGYMRALERLKACAAALEGRAHV